MTETESRTTLASATEARGFQGEARTTRAEPRETDQGIRDGASAPGARPSLRPVGAHTHACGAWWTGARTSHCGKCHRTLSSITAFDRHQRSKPGGGVECVDPASVGLVAVERPYGALWCCPVTGDGNPHAVAREESADA